MKNIKGDIIYVGKAKILKNRVRSYFQQSANQTIKVRKMVENIDDLDYIITDTEVEALLLECNLIKEYRPYYNILLKDDKSYPYLMLTMSEEYPRLVYTRRRLMDKNKYYGPYPGAYVAKKTMEAINRLYPLQMCRKNTHKNCVVGKVCLNYHMGQCMGVCTGNVDNEKYMHYVKEVDEILQGKTDVLIEKLTEQMLIESNNLRFENAQALKEQIEAVKSLKTRQKIDSQNFDERDIIAFATDQKTSCVMIFIVREGKIVKTETRYMKHNSEEKEEDVLENFITQYYTQNRTIPREIIIDKFPNDHILLERMLSKIKGLKVHFFSPSIGEKRRLLDLATQNALLNIENRKTHEERIKDSRKNALKEIGDILGINPPGRIESYDISNIQGADNVGVQIVFENGKKCPSLYRRYRIKYVQGQDDYASTAEIIFRRLNRAYREKEENLPNPKFLPLPSLILADGGMEHMKIIQNVIDTFHYSITVAGLVKNSKHKLRALVKPDGTEIPIKDIRYAYYLLNEISEEVHNQAISYHRLSRSKTMLKSELTSIKGIGEKKSQALMVHFASHEDLVHASLSELEKVEGITKENARQIYMYYNNKEK